MVLIVNDGTKLANATGRVAISVKINRPPVAVAGKNERVCTGRHRRPRRQPLVRSGRRRAPLFLDLRRRHVLGHRQPDQVLHQGRHLSGDADGAGQFRPAQRHQQLADRHPRRSGPGRQRRQGHPRLRQDRGRLRRLRLDRHRRRGQQLRLGFRRRQFRRRRHARPHLREAGHLSRLPEDRGREGRHLQRHLAATRSRSRSSRGRWR